MLYKKPRSKFTAQSVSSILSQCMVMTYTGAAVSWVLLQGGDAASPGSWWSALMVPAASVCLWLSVHLLEPMLVKNHKRWVAQSQKSVIFLTLGSECLLCSFLPAYLANHDILPKSEAWRAATVLALKGCVSMLLVGIMLSQTLDPLYPGYFVDRPAMMRTLHWIGFAVGALLSFAFSEFVFESAEFGDWLF